MKIVQPLIKFEMSQLEIMHSVGKTCFVRTDGIVKGLGDYVGFEVSIDDIQPFCTVDLSGKCMMDLSKDKTYNRFIKAIAKKEIEKQVTQMLLG